MAIKRCPYCRALISDEDQYCKNCGTQLLFPEDEDLEEEIPGERIVEDDLEDKESEEELREDDWEEKEEGEEEQEELAEVSEAEEDTEEVILVDEEQIAESQIKPKTSGTEEVGSKKPPPSEELFYGPDESELPFEREKTEELRRLDETKTDKTGGDEDVVKKIEKEIFSEKEARDNQQPSTGHPGLVTQVVEELKKKEEQSPDQPEEETKPGLVTQMVEELGVEEKRTAKDVHESETKKEPASVETSLESAELDEVGPTVEVGQRKVEDFFKVLEEKERDYLKEKAGPKGKEEQETGEVPSWIKEVKATSSESLAEEDTAEVNKLEPEKIEVETDQFGLEEKPSTEATMGFPEKLTQSPEQLEEPEELTGEKNMELEEELEEKAGSEDYTFEKTPEMFAGRSAKNSQRGPGANRSLAPMGFKNFIKAKIFDLLFLIMFWLISIWLAARSMETNIFKLMGVASSGLLIYLLILTFFYFFLFYFFMGETLGDRLFREGEEDSLSTRSQG
ncbi:MAG: hypothetical protein PHQ25_07715 [Acidobacteriota bacterium]|nr:hypothetical protein [Acidobacteriota bacterium]